MSRNGLLCPWAGRHRNFVLVWTFASKLACASLFSSLREARWAFISSHERLGWLVHTARTVLQSGDTSSFYHIISSASMGLMAMASVIPSDRFQSYQYAFPMVSWPTSSGHVRLIWIPWYYPSMIVMCVCMFSLMVHAHQEGCSKTTEIWIWTRAWRCARWRQEQCSKNAYDTHCHYASVSHQSTLSLRVSIR